MSSQIRALVEGCDLEKRLALVPSSAKLRGLYFKNTITVLEASEAIHRYREIYPETYSAVKWYSVGEFLERLAVAGALLEGPERVHEGMRLIGRQNASAFAESLLGRTLIRLLAKDPERILKQASAGRRQSCRYGRWEIEFPAPGRATMHLHEEYLWIESYVLGAAEGTIGVTSREARVRVELDSPFQGRHYFEWPTVSRS